MLIAAAEYFFNRDGGKKIRPTMVLLMAYACNADAAAAAASAAGLAAPPAPPALSTAAWLERAGRAPCFAAQRRLAEIAEMIHTARARLGARGSDPSRTRKLSLPPSPPLPVAIAS